MSKAWEIAEKIKDLKHDYEDDEISVKIHPYPKLIDDTTDWPKPKNANTKGLKRTVGNIWKP
jgi:hypothetical protein